MLLRWRIRPPRGITIAYHLREDGSYTLLWVVTVATPVISEVLLPISGEEFITKKYNPKTQNLPDVGDMRLFTETVTLLQLARQFTHGVVNILVYVRPSALPGSVNGA